MFAIPLLGILIALWLTYYFQRISYTSEEPDYKEIRFDEFYTRFPVVKRKFGESAMHEVMQTDKIPLSLRLNALSALAEHTNKTHFSLIKKMLSSHNDEIRLFSFSIVDKLEQEINEKIHQAQQQYRSENKETKAKAAQSLAFLYWELIYFELIDDILVDTILNDIETYIREAFVLFPNEYSLYFLLGRVYFKKGNHHQAKQYFHKAIELGEKQSIKNIHFIQPYLAEIDYNLRAFSKVKDTIIKTEYFNLNHKLNPIKEIWAR